MKRFAFLFIFTSLVWLSPAQDTGLKIITFNIRYDNPQDSEYSWKFRRPLMVDLLRSEQPDLIGFQEVLKNQLSDLSGSLKDYSWFGIGRDDGKDKGEFSVIFFRSGRFTRLGGSTFWLSLTPDVPGSRSWNSACTRIVTWVKLADKESGRVFFIFNTHFDHVSVLARSESAKMLLQRVHDIAGKNTSIITGDFNDTLKSAPLNILTSGTDGFTNTADLSKKAPEGPDYSFIGFPFDPSKGNTIDFIFLKNKGNIEVAKHRVITYHAGNKYPSDHLPVCTEIRIPARHP